MAGESLTQMARKKNAEHMAARKKAEAARSGPALVVSSDPAKTSKEVGQPVIERLIPEERGKKRSAEGEAGSEDSLADKRPHLEESDVVAPFIVQPKIRDTPIPSDASIITDPAVALSLAALAVGRIADLGHCLHDALERIDLFAVGSGRMEIELAELKAAKEKAESEAFAAFEAGKGASFKEYVDEVPRFENRGFKHGWLKALGAAGVTLALPIPYEQVDVEPIESDPED
ncbi:hypothetical protein HYC85_028340 [Camellia sinensis]|uniref:Uncharacterized protein n=1 Tax=Camellia sinensis TaxID=4442 RepID=A0A7J7FV60_CAMSI|nr:hypothetical protein HYC85_028340 [Camellia sinensis]